MSLHELYRRWAGRLRTARQARARLATPRGVRLAVEPLEDRTLPSTWAAATLPNLSANGQAVNQSDTIKLRRVISDGVFLGSNAGADGHLVASVHTGGHKGHSANGGDEITGL